MLDPNQREGDSGLARDNVGVVRLFRKPRLFLWSFRTDDQKCLWMRWKPEGVGTTEPPVFLHLQARQGPTGSKRRTNRDARGGPTRAVRFEAASRNPQHRQVSPADGGCPVLFSCTKDRLVTFHQRPFASRNAMEHRQLASC